MGSCSVTPTWLSQTLVILDRGNKQDAKENRQVHGTHSWIEGEKLSGYIRNALSNLVTATKSHVTQIRRHGTHCFNKESL